MSSKKVVYKEKEKEKENLSSAVKIAI